MTRVCEISKVDILFVTAGNHVHGSHQLVIWLIANTKKMCLRCDVRTQELADHGDEISP